MNPSKPRLLVLLLPLVSFTPACEQLPEFRYETPHLRIATEFDEPLCRGDLDEYELVITTLESTLNTNLDDRVDVYLWDLTSSPPDWCTLEDVVGCFSDGVVYADQASLNHELVHVVVTTMGSPGAFWREGTATSLQSERTYYGAKTPTDNIDLEFPQLDYATAGHFSRWLFKTQGVERYRALLRAPGASREAFEQTYDMTIEDAQVQYLQDAPYSYGAFIACKHPELPQVGVQQWSETIDVACDKPSVHGGPLGMGAYRVLTISERGNYTFSTTAEMGVISACRDVDLESPPVEGDPALGDVPPYTNQFLALRALAGDGELTTLDLVPGRYELVIGFPQDFEPRQAQIDVQGTSP